MASSHDVVTYLHSLVIAHTTKNPSIFVESDSSDQFFVGVPFLDDLASRSVHHDQSLVGSTIDDQSGLNRQ